VLSLSSSYVVTKRSRIYRILTFFENRWNLLENWMYPTKPISWTPLFLGKPPRLSKTKILEVIFYVCQAKICCETEQNKFLFAMSDDTTDVSEHTQLLVFFRYDLEGAAHKWFWGFCNPKNSKCWRSSRVHFRTIKFNFE
jgi:hypothetical protein